ncbi:hypothetical protein GBA52_022765 [Prunus armeniaca]|nr:hypothetical protein GBA52_022765 [Prunus armeniaca]
MEDPNPAQPTVTQIANPPNSEEVLAPQPLPVFSSSKTKKRPLDNDAHYLQLQLLQGSRRPQGDSSLIFLRLR